MDGGIGDLYNRFAVLPQCFCSRYPYWRAIDPVPGRHTLRVWNVSESALTPDRGVILRPSLKAQDPRSSH